MQVKLDLFQAGISFESQCKCKQIPQQRIKYERTTGHENRSYESTLDAKVKLTCLVTVAHPKCPVALSSLLQHNDTALSSLLQHHT